MEILSSRLRALRGVRSQAAFAKELGITQQRYANYESGIREPDLTTLCRIAALTTGSVDELLGVKDLAPPDRSRDKVADLKKAIITLLKEY
jgi:transcriptional regulator with XRE-family HTH domain